MPPHTTPSNIPRVPGPFRPPPANGRVPRPETACERLRRPGAVEAWAQETLTVARLAWLPLAVLGLTFLGGAFAVGVAVGRVWP